MARTKEARNAWLREWCKRNPEKRFMRYFRARLKRKYGMTPEQYTTLLRVQDYKCYLCRIPLIVPTATNRIVRNGACAVIDHIHDVRDDKLSGVRGVLCNNCNRALGLFKDSAVVIRRAAAYVERTTPYFVPWRRGVEILKELSHEG